VFACEAVDLGSSTPPRPSYCHRSSGRPPSEVFAAFAHDPANWGEFFPALTQRVAITRRRRRVSLSLHEASRWHQGRRDGPRLDEGERFAFRVDSTAAPAFQAWVEDTTLSRTAVTAPC